MHQNLLHLQMATAMPRDEAAAGLGARETEVWGDPRQLDRVAPVSVRDLTAH